MQKRRNYIANALELRLFYIKPLISFTIYNTKEAHDDKRLGVIVILYYIAGKWKFLLYICNILSSRMWVYSLALREIRLIEKTNNSCNKSKSCIKLLTHCGRDRMVDILRTTFSNAFSWMKIYEFRLKFHYSFFLRFKLTGHNLYGTQTE